MNKTKIQDLVKQAVEQANQELKNTDLARWYSDRGRSDELIFEKFAELIVNECIDVVIECDTNPKMVLHEPYRSIVSDIQDHFYGP